MNATIRWTTLFAASLLFALGACSGGTDTTTGGSGTGGAGGTGNGAACDGSPITAEELIAIAPGIICGKYKECCPSGFMDGPISGTGADCEAEVTAALQQLYGMVGPDPRTDWDAAKAGQCCNETFLRLDMGSCSEPALFGPEPPATSCLELITGLQDVGAACDREEECRSGLRCDDQTMTCVMPAADGASCSGALCQVRAYCDQADMTCKPKLANGDSCAGSDQCLSGICGGGTCSAYSSFQDTCVN
jgi:hypothetical protein